MDPSGGSSAAMRRRTQVFVVGAAGFALVGKNVTPCDNADGMATGTDEPFSTRGVIFTLDPSPAQEHLLLSYCGAARFAYNWAVCHASANLTARRAEREAGIPDEDATSPISWSATTWARPGTSPKAPWRPGGVRSRCTPSVRNGRCSSGADQLLRVEKECAQGPGSRFPQIEEQAALDTVGLLRGDQSSAELAGPGSSRCSLDVAQVESGPRRLPA